MSTRTLAATLLGVCLLVGGGYGVHLLLRGGSPRAATVCPHSLTAADCPFCTPSLLETKGFCAGHGVPEAICTRCHKNVIPAFKVKGDWCSEHELPESQCVKCDPALAEKLKPKAGGGHGQSSGGMCAEHGVPESMCFICAPKLVEEGGQCAEHGVPEALCTRCNAALIPAFKKTFDWCAEHSLPESQCVTCNPRLAEAQPASPPAPTSPDERQRAQPRDGCRTHAQKIELASVEIVRQVGVATTKVVSAPFEEVLEVNAEVVHRTDRRAELSSRAPGVVAEVCAELGDWVEQGEVVVRVESPELGSALNDISVVSSLLEVWERNRTRETDLAGRGVGTQRAVIEAETRRAEARAELSRAEQRLRSFGLSAEQVDELRRGPGRSTLDVRAPFPGLVVAREAVLGRVVGAGAPLVTIVDTSTVWAELALPETASARVKQGQPVVISLQALPGEHFAGQVSWIASEIDRRSRTLAVRAELDNARELLRANLFGTAKLTLSSSASAVVVPRDAVQWEGCCNVVFVPEGDRAFRPRKVRIGGITATHAEVLEGLAEGEAVVSTGAFLLKTELLKGSIGAGCCEGE